MKISMPLTACTLALATAAPAFALEFGYTVATDNFLYEINLTTGVATRVGAVPVGLGLVEGLAFSSPGVLIGVGEVIGQQLQRQIWTLSAPPGTLRTQTNHNTDNDAGLAAYQGDAYLVYGGLTDASLFSTDLDTANNIISEPISFPGGDGTLDGLAISAGGVAFASDAILQDGLFTVSFVGTATFLGNFGLGDIQQNSGLDFNAAGVLYMLLSDGGLYTVNTITGAATAIAPVTFNGNPLTLLGGFAIGDINAVAAVVVPEPTTMTLAMLGIISLTLLRRERR